MIGNALLLALRELRRNVMRSFLTMLGIIIGVAAVIIQVSVEDGASTERVKQEIGRLLRTRRHPSADPSAKSAFTSKFKLPYCTRFGLREAPFDCPARCAPSR